MFSIAAGLTAAMLLGGCRCGAGEAIPDPPPEGWMWVTDGALGVRAAMPAAPIREVRTGTETLPSGEPVEVTLVAYRVGISGKSLEISGVSYPEGVVAEVGAEALYHGMRDTVVTATSATLVSEAPWSSGGHRGWASTLTTPGAGVLELRTWVDGDHLVQASFLGRSSPVMEEFFSFVTPVDTVSMMPVSISDGRLTALCPGPCSTYSQVTAGPAGEETVVGVQSVLDGVHFGVSVTPVALGPLPPDTEAGMDAVREGVLSQWKVTDHEEEESPFGAVEGLRMHFVTETEVSVDMRLAVVDGLLINAAVLAPVGAEPHWTDTFLASVAWTAK